MSVKEVAEVLGAPQGTIKSRLFAARRALREKLSEPGVHAPVLAQADEEAVAGLEAAP
jgi:RNA polymerase sigma-70 factor (ECF subfamily)